MPGAEVFARWIFRAAAIYGVIVLVPLLFADVPHPYRLNLIGFAGLALVFQAMFWMVASDPRRHLSLIPLGIAEKLVFGLPAVLFWMRGHNDGVTAAFGAIDLLLAMLFLLAWHGLRRKPA